MMKLSNHNSLCRPVLVAALLSVFLALTIVGDTDGLWNLPGRSLLDQANEQYLRESRARAAELFASLTVLKTGLSVIEGSAIGVSVGVSGQVEAGDVVQCILDCVDYVWRAVLVAMVVLFMMGVTLKLSAFLGLRLLLAGCVFGCLYQCLREWGPRWVHLRTTARCVATASLIGGTSLYFLLPLSVYATSRLSREFTLALHREARAEFERLGNEILPSQTGLQNTNAHQVVRAATVHMRMASRHLTEWMAMLSSATTKLVGAYLLDCVGFPLAVLFMLTQGCRRLLSCALGSLTSELVARNPDGSPGHATPKNGARRYAVSQASARDAVEAETANQKGK